MTENPFDIIHSVTIKRKPKKVLIPDSVFTSGFHSDFIQSKEYRPPNLSPWRVTSSGVVARGNPQVPQNQATNTESSYFQPSDSLSSLNLPKDFAMADRLRTPIRNKHKTSGESDSTMTRNCEQLFSRMSSFKEVKPEVSVDPSQSVRRIIQGSGLLKAFGTGLIQQEEDQSRSFSNETGASEQEVLTGSSSPTVNSDTVLNSSNSETSELEKNSFQLFSQSPTSPFFYDTVVMKKTVETELVEYLPTKNYKGFQLFSTSCDNMKRTSSDASSRDSPPPPQNNKKRTRFNDHVLEHHFLFQ